MLVVADWSQAKIGYTIFLAIGKSISVADWSQAKIGYTQASGCGGSSYVADWSQAKIGYTTLQPNLIPSNELRKNDGSKKQ